VLTALGKPVATRSTLSKMATEQEQEYEVSSCDLSLNTASSALLLSLWLGSRGDDVVVVEVVRSSVPLCDV
jgi:hypothetical protein